MAPQLMDTPVVWSYSHSTFVKARFSIAQMLLRPSVFEREDGGRRIGNRYVVIAVFLQDVAGHGRAHRQPHQQLHTLRSRVTNDVESGIPRQRLGIRDDLVDAHQIESLVDEPSPFAIELMRQ